LLPISLIEGGLMNKDKESDLDEIIEMFEVSLEMKNEQMSLLKQMNTNLRYLKRSVMWLQVSIFLGILIIGATLSGL
jgi:hypothetical protein